MCKGIVLISILVPFKISKGGIDMKFAISDFLLFRAYYAKLRDFIV